MTEKNLVEGRELSMVFCYQNCRNCFSDREKLLKFDAEGRQFAKVLRSLEEFIQTVKGQNNFLQQNAFLICSWGFLIPNKLEQLEFRFEKNGIWIHAGKVRKTFFYILAKLPSVLNCY